MKLFLKYISIAFFTAVLFGCESEGNSTPEPITPPTPPPVFEAQLSAMDFHTAVQFSQPNQPLTFNISNFIAYSKAENITLKNIEVLSDSQTCQITKLDAEQQSFTIKPNKAGSCDYRYTISTKGEEKDAWASITFSATQGVQKARNDFQIIPKDNLLPDINKATSVGESISFSIYDELSSELLAMTNPVFETSTVVEGSGLAFITENGDFSYDAVDIGVTKVSYSVVDDNGLAFTGLIKIDVSGDINTAPITNDATYERTQAVGDELSLDIMKFPGFGPLVNDAEGDKIQLVSVQALNAEVKLVDANDVTNTSFTFRGDNKALYKVNYTVYDHEVDGISTGTITIETGYIREGILEFSFNGFIKLFGDGALGAAGRNTLMKPFKETLLPYMQDNGLYATGLKNIGFGNYRIDMSSENGDVNDDKIILFTALNALQPIETLIELPATSQVYYGLTYADRIVGYGGIVYEVTQAGRAIAHNQIYGTSNTCYGDFTDKFNNLNLSDVKKVESFGTLSAVVYFNDNTATYYSIDCGSTGKFISKKWTQHISKISQCWDAPDNGKQHGSFYCLNKDQSDQAFTRVVGPQEVDEKGNIYLKFANFFKNTGKQIVKSTQVPKGIAALTTTGDLYVLFDGKDDDGDNYKVVKVATKVSNYQQAANYVTYMRNYEGTKLEFGGYAQYHQETTPTGKTLDLTIDFDDMHKDKRRKVSFYENTANAVAVLVDGELHALTTKGFHKLDKKDHSNNIVGDSANSYGVRTDTAGQGKSTFFARGNDKHSTHWDLLSPLKDVDKSYECPKVEDGQVHYPYILTGCTYIDFKMNGAVVPSADSGITVFPTERFSDTDAAGIVYPDLVDLDNDGLSTEQEVTECLTKPSVYDASKVEYCSQPILSDSDGDDVLDSFEFLYQDIGKGNYYSRFSHLVGEYKNNELGPYDGNKDINSNNQQDKYDN